MRAQAHKILTAFIILLGFFSVKEVHAQIVALGASNVQGYGVAASEAFPAQLEALLRRKGLNYSVSNEGVFGDTTAGVLSRLDSATPSGTRIVVLAIGGNDVRRGASVEEARAGVRTIIARLRARGIRVINAMPVVFAVARAGYVLPDRIHLSPEGHRRVAERVAAQIN